MLSSSGVIFLASTGLAKLPYRGKSPGAIRAALGSSQASKAVVAMQPSVSDTEIVHFHAMRRLLLVAALLSAGSVYAQAGAKSIFDVQTIEYADIQLDMLCGTAREQCTVKFTPEALIINGSEEISYDSIVDSFSEVHTHCSKESEIRDPYLTLNQGSCITLYSLVAFKYDKQIRVALFLASKRTTFDSFVINMFLRRNQPRRHGSSVILQQPANIR